MNYNYNGFLNVYKEPGWTSMDVCAKLKGILGVRKIGHAGTLDPMAEGVLPVAVGRATKDISLLDDAIKVYRAGMLLGIETDTEDITGRAVKVMGMSTGTREVNEMLQAGDRDKDRPIGEIVLDKEKLPSEKAIREAIMSFAGGYEQLTPMYSARKVNGKRLYEYARKGQEAERKKKAIRIYDISIDEVNIPYVTFTVSCSRGTYIRSLCRDIGEKLGCGACMYSLKRLKVGDFGIEQALKLDEIASKRQDRSLDQCFRILSPTAISIGKFDGTHVGHQALIRELRKLAEKKRLKTCVIIFTSGRDSVLSNAERKHRLYELGVDYCMEMEFNDELINMSAEAFLKDVLIGRYNMKAIAAGEDVSFGKGREGNAEYLKAHADELKYEILLIKKVRINFGEAEKKDKNTDPMEKEQEISSTLLRQELMKGDMLHVTRLLGTPYAISGTVVHGRHVGTDMLDAPTLNIEVPEGILVPPRGVYAARVYITGQHKDPGSEMDPVSEPRGLTGADRGQISGTLACTGYGIANLGIAPTVRTGSSEDAGRLYLEANVFGDIGDCYGCDAKVELCYFLRGEQTFDSPEELKEQILDHDIPEAKKYFGIDPALS